LKKLLQNDREAKAPGQQQRSSHQSGVPVIMLIAVNHDVGLALCRKRNTVAKRQ